MPPLTNLGEDDTVAQIVSVDGDVLASSPMIEGLPPIGDPITAGQTIGNGEPLPGIDGDVRLLSRIVKRRDGDVIVYLAASTDDINDSVTTLITSLSIAVPLAAGVLAALIWFLVGRTLRPVEQIRAEVAAIGGSELHRRVPVPEGDDEIVRLARTMNDMLERVDEASGRQRRFVADASHELRSPLTRMRSELEVDLAHPDGADPTATLESVLEEVVGLQRLADDLLLLARNTALETPAAHRQDLVDLATVADRVGQGIVVRDGVQVEVRHDGAAPVLGNATELVRAIGNLADNATRHARSVARIVVSSAPGAVTVAVEDDGPGIPTGEHERIFERFARLDEGRSGDRRRYRPRLGDRPRHHRTSRWQPDRRHRLPQWREIRDHPPRRQRHIHRHQCVADNQHQPLNATAWPTAKTERTWTEFGKDVERRKPEAGSTVDLEVASGHVVEVRTDHSQQVADGDSTVAHGWKTTTGQLSNCRVV